MKAVFKDVHEKLYSASNLERLFLCFVVNNNYVFCYKKVTIIAIKLKFGLNVHSSYTCTSLLNVFGKFKCFCCLCIVSRGNSGSGAIPA